MKDLALVIVSVVLGALLSRTWGHRRVLHLVKEQLDLIEALPKDWHAERRDVTQLAARDMARYIRYRKPRMPRHRFMLRAMDVAWLGGLVFAFSQMSFVPGPDIVKDWAGVAGITITAVAVWVNLVYLVQHNREIDAELKTGND